MKKYELVFDKVIFKQLKKLNKNNQIKSIISKMFDNLESNGGTIGKMLNNQLMLFELKNKRPSIRLYYKIMANNIEIYILEYELKKNKKKQIITIERLKTKIRDLFLYIFFLKYYFQILKVFYIV
jgi:mRNA-degrading endonuclease RelE of RelBE toxin-antitoxin system